MGGGGRVGVIFTITTTITIRGTIAIRTITNIIKLAVRLSGGGMGRVGT